MPPIAEVKPEKIDIRLYIGMLFFRWHVIAVCFLYCLLGGVVYLHLAPKQYQANARIMVYRDPALTIPEENRRWDTMGAHAYLLESWEVRNRVAQRLKAEWGTRTAGEQIPLPTRAWQVGGLGPTLQVSVNTRNAEYGVAFLDELIREHEAEWKSIQMEAGKSASEILEQELVRLEEKIDDAENEMVEFERLHDIHRMAARGASEGAFLSALMGRKTQIATELMILDAEYDAAQKEDAVVINQVNVLTQETGAVRPSAAKRAAGPGEAAEGADGPEAAAAATPAAAQTEAAVPLPDALNPKQNISEVLRDGSGWEDLRVKYARLMQEQKEAARNLKPEHPRLKEIADQMKQLEERLNVAKEVELRRMRDRKKALTTHLDAIEAAEYKWQAKDLLAAKRQSEMRRIESVVGRYERNYDTLYSRLHTMRVSEELKAEHFSVVQPPEALKKPLWPDPLKVLLMAVGLGLGLGFGLAIVSQFFDNKVQTIKDVETELGIQFLGGIPFWVHSGLEKAIRPIVTEEHASGAVEAYRALRTIIIAAMEKVNEKIILITSADSREGKTLTALNLAIVMAQMNKKVLLLDLDLRRGRLHRSLGVDKDPGITDALKERKSLREVIRPSRIDNLYVAPAGSGVEDSAELLQSSDLVSMFVDIQDDYDYLVADTSPVLRATDTVILATHGLGVVAYVARVNHTPKPLIRYSLDMLEEARVLGLIMNSIEMHKVSSLYYTYQYPNYAYYSNAYAYGYDYYHFDDTTRSGRHAARRAVWQARRRQFSRWLRNTFLPAE